MTATPDLVLREAIRPGIARLTLNRPDKRNALSVALMESVLQALDAIEADSGNRILLLEGAGPSFCAGLDLAEAAETAKHHRSSELVSTLLQRLATSRLVTFALVRGSALGGGAGLMSACDFALADPGATIGYPEPRRGIVAALVMIFLRRQLAERDARKLLLTGEPITGAEAERIRLVTATAAPGDLLPLALKLAEQVLLGGPESIVRTKRLFAALWPTPIAEEFERAYRIHLEARQSAELEEGAAAFREKRPPRWAQ
ncbi:MAG TPA: enoyl-CoA hydratase/isomerase family protein [Lacunisphaera sp.]|jgi:methylglutaconyl-CoA hydratase|nr:enoyl-CoA hydratase/isomerase family protein [Lacunisphaera sp.]